jgi:hypothetical protein
VVEGEGKKIKGKKKTHEERVGTFFETTPPTSARYNVLVTRHTVHVGLVRTFSPAAATITVVAIIIVMIIVIIISHV